jgi:hypothetical protein
MRSPFRSIVNLCLLPKCAAAKAKEEEAKAAAAAKAAPAPAPAAPAAAPAAPPSGSGLGVVGGSATGGKVLPKEEVSEDVKAFLKTLNK